MGEIEKLTIIKTTGYLEQIRDASYDHLTNYEENFFSDEYTEEKNYMSAVSTSVCHVGKWCLSMQKPVD